MQKALRLAIIISLLFIFNLSTYASPFVSEYSILHDKPHFNEVTGRQIFQSVCKGCHMVDGAGAIGAGYYPAIADDEKLYAPSYPIYMILEGSGNMPAFKNFLTDEQVMNVVNYIRTNFGNHAQDSVTIQQIKEVSKR